VRTKLWVAGVVALLAFYLVLTVQSALRYLAAPEPTARIIGAAALLLPLVGAWVLIRELLFGARTEKLAGVLEREGGLPADNLPRTPSGRIVRAAADAEFEKYRLAAERAPEDWRSWFRLSCAYDAAGDRKRARKAMRDAIALSRGKKPAADQA
jgi:hypothetical protein